jgi:hypothetical protein
MKPPIQLRYLGLLRLIWLTLPLFDCVASTDYRTTLAGVTAEVEAGNYDALSEASKLPADVAVPYLELWTRLKNCFDTKANEAAANALRNTNGAVQYITRDLAARTAQNNVALYDFVLLEIIRTQEAAAAVAPYLFDFKTSRPPNGDLPGDDNWAEAYNTLNRMNLPDTPSSNPPARDSLLFVEWQKWAVAKGYVPKDWSSRVGAPQVFLALEKYGVVFDGSPINPSKPAPSTSASPSPTP